MSSADSPVHAIKASALSRAFNGADAVKSIDLEVREGELFGLIGPDGAGKTTTLRLLAAILEPTSGEALVCGYSISKEAEQIKRMIGYMPQRFGLYEDLTVSENIRFFADIYEVPRKLRLERTARLLGFSNLTPFQDRLAGDLSGGMKQKLGLACALIHTPRLLLLDEPTNGVDPVSRRDFWRLLYGLLKEGITIFITTAYLDEAERCTRIALMHQGGILAVQAPEGLRRSLGFSMLELRTDEPRRAHKIIASLEGVKMVTAYGDRLHFAGISPERADEINAALSKDGIAVKGVRQVLPSLEDVFISMTGHDRQ